MTDIIENVTFTDVETEELQQIDGGMFGLADCPGWVWVGGAVSTGAIVPAYCFIAWL